MRLIVERRSLRAAFRALVETTGIFAFITCDSPAADGVAACRRIWNAGSASNPTLSAGKNR